MSLDSGVGAHRRCLDGLGEMWCALGDKSQVRAHVLAEHVVGRADVYTVPHLLVGCGVGLPAEIEPLREPL